LVAFTPFGAKAPFFVKGKSLPLTIPEKLLTAKVLSKPSPALPPTHAKTTRVPRLGNGGAPPDDM